MDDHLIAELHPNAILTATIAWAAAGDPEALAELRDLVGEFFPTLTASAAGVLFIELLSRGDLMPDEVQVLVCDFVDSYRDVVRDAGLTNATPATREFFRSAGQTAAPEVVIEVCRSALAMSRQSVARRQSIPS
jgi:hypothetical protein